MKTDYLKQRKELASLVLLGLSAALALMIAVRIAGFFVASARAEKLIADAAVITKTDPNDTEKYFAKSKEMAEELKKKNLFAPPPKKQNPVKGVSGIIVPKALINGKWHKVGDKIGDAEVMEIEPMSVKVKWEGKEKVHRVFDFKSPDKPKKEERVVRRSRRKKKDEKPDTAEEGSRVRRPRRGRRDFSELSEEQRERIRERRRQRGSRQGRRRRGSRQERGGRGSRTRRERDE
jgi:hypothetical protein